MPEAISTAIVGRSATAGGIGQSGVEDQAKKLGGDKITIFFAGYFTRKRTSLAGEPTANPDRGNGKEVMDLLTDLNHNRMTIIMVTHLDDDARYCQRVIQLDQAQTVRTE